MGNNQSSYEAILKDASKKSSSGSSILFQFSKTYPAYIILVITLVVSYFAYNFMKDMVTNDRQAAFDKAVTSVMTRFEQNYQNKAQVISSMKGLFDNSFVVRDVFELNAKVPINTDKSIVNINYITRTSKEKLEEWIYNTRSEGYFDLKVHPEADRAEYFLVSYVVPFEGNEQRSGYDFTGNETVLSAIKSSMENNKYSVTDIFDIRDGVEGFFLIATIYQKDSVSTSPQDFIKNYAGSIAIEIDAKKFFDLALGDGIATDSTIVFEVSESSNKTIWKSKNSNLIQSDFVALIEDTKSFKIADKELQVKFRTIPNFGGEFQARLPLLTLIGAVLTSFVLFGFVISVITSKARALDLAERMTRSQRRIVDSSQDIIAVMDFQGVWKSMNPASNVIFAMSPDQMINNNIEQLFVDNSEKKVIAGLSSNPNEEFVERVDLQMKTKTNEVKWINWSFTVSKSDGLIYCIGRDVTLEKIQEEQAKLRTKQIQLAEQFSREASESKTYFLTKLGHQLRNSLTGIVGYLQLVSGKIYETEEELDSFIEMAEQSSEELFTFVSDLVEKSEQSEEATNVNIATVSFDKIITTVNKRLIAEQETGQAKVKVEIMNPDENVKMVADANILSDALINVYWSMSAGVDECKFQITAQENRQEGATEIQIVSSANPLVAEMIDVYKKNKNHIIEAMKFDKKDILLDLATVESNIRRMNGTMQVDSFGATEGNVIMLTMPLNKPAEN